MREMSAGSECSYGKLSCSEQYTRCTCWNGDTEQTSRAYKSHSQKKGYRNTWGAIATNSTLFSEGCFFPLIIMFQVCQKKNSTPRGAKLWTRGVLFRHPFFSECTYVGLNYWRIPCIIAQLHFCITFLTCF